MLYVLCLKLIVICIMVKSKKAQETQVGSEDFDTKEDKGV
jgi:hypothetical protein